MPTSATTVDQASAQSRAARWEGRAAVQRFTRLSRIRGCGTPCAPEVSIARGIAGKAVVGGVATCASVWSCEVCAAKIRQARADEIRAIDEWWRHDQGGAVYMLTLTVPHNAGDDLATLWELVAKSWSSTIAGRAWQRMQQWCGIEGWARAIEVRVGANGWHPHLHVLVFCHKGAVEALGERLPVELERWFVAAWAGAVKRRSGRVISPDGQSVTKTSADYIAKLEIDVRRSSKIGMEMTRHDLKTGESRSPFDLARDASETGEASDLRLWWEWEKVSHSKRALTWSCGFRRRAAAAAGDEKTDEEIALEGEADDDQVVVVPAAGWRRAGWRRQTEALDLVELGQHQAAADLLGGAVTQARPVRPDPRDAQWREGRRRQRHREARLR